MSPARYVVRVREPHAHRLEVEATFPAAGDSLELAFPVWSPGSYLVREYGRHVERLEADAAGRALDVRKTAKNRWRIATGGASEVTARYGLYAHELSVRTNHVDSTHAFWVGPATYVYDPERLDRLALLRVEAPDGWHVATALDPAPAETGWLLAPDLDTLMDAPVEVGAHEVLAGTACGKPFQIVLWGDPRFDRAELVTEVTRIVEAEAAVFGGLPWGRYLFQLHVAVGARGGLEHERSSTCGASPHAFETRTGRLDLLSLLAHEHFHVWNVKRIRPAGLVPYRYEQENYTRALWIAEGATTYYDWHTLVRAGIATRGEYLRHLAERIRELESIPGRRVQSLEEASFDAWVKLYRPDESSPNVGVSYYLKGEVVWAMIDLELRARSGGRVSSDDVMRRLAALGTTPEDAREVFEDVEGVTAADVFDRAVRGRDELDVGGTLARAGLRLERERKVGAPTAALGVRIAVSAGRPTVASVERGGAAETAGLSPGDELVAWEGFRIDEPSLRDRLAARAPGDEVTLTAFRREKLTEVRVRLGEAPRDDYRIVPDPDAAPEAKAIGDAWLAGAKEGP